VFRSAQAYPKSAVRHKVPFDSVLVTASSCTPSASDRVQDEREVRNVVGICVELEDIVELGPLRAGFWDDVEFNGGAHGSFTSFQVKRTIERDKGSLSAGAGFAYSCCNPGAGLGGARVYKNSGCSASAY
jgi:hypothetical protein